MAIRLNVYCNGQLGTNEPFRDNFEKIKWGPGAVPRDALGIPIQDGCNDLPREVEEDADLQE